MIPLWSSLGVGPKKLKMKAEKWILQHETSMVGPFKIQRTPSKNIYIAAFPNFGSKNIYSSSPHPFSKKIFTHFTCLFFVVFPNITPVPAFFHWFNCRRETQTWDATPSALRGETPYEIHDLGSFYFLPKSDVNKRITYITRSELTFFSVF